jgi:hypothetical protein
MNAWRIVRIATLTLCTTVLAAAVGGCGDRTTSSAAATTTTLSATQLALIDCETTTLDSLTGTHEDLMYQYGTSSKEYLPLLAEMGWFSVQARRWGADAATNDELDRIATYCESGKFPPQDTRRQLR